MAFIIKRNDLLPVYRAQLLQTDPETNTTTPVDLSTITSVKFLMSANAATTAKVASAATVDDGPNGIVSYSWISGDTNLSGTYNVEIEVTWTSGKRQTFPADSYLTVKVVDDLG
jgi:hypothetical protein